jgi:hypothetical protein
MSTNMQYRIYDKDETPQRLPMQKLIHQICKVIAHVPDTCKIFKSRGYGLQINEWEEVLDSVDSILVPFALLEKISKGTEEWFYDLEAEVTSEGDVICFGLQDSTALFIDASSRIAPMIIDAFRNVRLL